MWLLLSWCSVCFIPAGAIVITRAALAAHPLVAADPAEMPRDIPRSWTPRLYAIHQFAGKAGAHQPDVVPSSGSSRNYNTCYNEQAVAIREHKILQLEER